MGATKEDLLAVADATFKQFAKKYPGLALIRKIEFKKCQSGWARYRVGAITIPTWLFKAAEVEGIHWMIHEMAHFAAPRGARHNQTFKTIEREMNEPWGITIDYARAYAKRLYLDGKVAWERAPRRRAAAKTIRRVPLQICPLIVSGST